MSLIGKKVVFSVPKSMESGGPSKEQEIIKGVVMDKVLCTYPNPLKPEYPVLAYDIYIVRTEKNELIPLNPSYAIGLEDES